MTHNSSPTLTALGALVVKEARPGYAGPSRWEKVRKAVDDGLPVEAVKELQAELKRLGVPRPSEYVDSIVSRATRQRRNRLKPGEGEQLVRVASLLALAVDVWGETIDADDKVPLRGATVRVEGRKHTDVDVRETVAHYLVQLVPLIVVGRGRSDRWLSACSRGVMRVW